MPNPPSDLDLGDLLRQCWEDPSAYLSFRAAVLPVLAATLFFYEGDAQLVNDSCQEALDALESELRKEYDVRHNYLLHLIALAHGALGLRVRAQICTAVAAQFGISVTALFSVLYNMAELGARRCSWVWRAHLLITDGDPFTLVSCLEIVQRSILRLGTARR